MRRLCNALGQHLEDEERYVLDLVCRHVTVAEWEAHGIDVMT
jgi:hypothetical protein